MNKNFKINIFNFLLTGFLFLFFTSNFVFAIEKNTDIYTQKPLIKDEFAINTLDKNKYPKYVFKKVKIEDNLITEYFVKEHANENYQSVKEEIRDFFAEKQLKQYITVVYEPKKYNFARDKYLTVKISSVENISTANLEQEGQILDFYVLNDVKNNETLIIPEKAKIRGRVENISPNDINGIPADLIVGSFNYHNGDKEISLDGQIVKTGANRVYWVQPLAYTAGCFLIGADILVSLIKGGHAKINKDEIFEIFLLVED